MQKNDVQVFCKLIGLKKFLLYLTNFKDFKKYMTECNDLFGTILVYL